MTDRQRVGSMAGRCNGRIGLSKNYPPGRQAMIEGYVLSALEAREKQGLSRHIEDTDVLDKIVALLAPPRASRGTAQSPAA